VFFLNIAIDKNLKVCYDYKSVEEVVFLQLSFINQRKWRIVMSGLIMCLSAVVVLVISWATEFKTGLPIDINVLGIAGIRVIVIAGMVFGLSAFVSGLKLANAKFLMEVSVEDSNDFRYIETQMKVSIITQDGNNGSVKIVPSSSTTVAKKEPLEDEK